MPIFAHMTQSIPTLGSAPSLSLAAISPMFTNMLIGVFLMISIAMILLVLIQRPQGGGLSGAFGSGGGGGAGQTAFGTKTGDVLTWATIGIFIAFLSFAIVLNFATRPQKASSATPVFSAPGGTSSPTGDGDAFDLSGNPLDTLGEQDTDGDADEGTPADETTGDTAPGETGSETNADQPADDE